MDNFASRVQEKFQPDPLLGNLQEQGSEIVGILPVPRIGEPAFLQFAEEVFSELFKLKDQLNFV